ncbi:MAG: DUF5808 domain-containing protein [Daejeonella sp.]
MDQNSPQNWKFGVFYFNKNDDRIIVPKRYAELGWTLNFAHKAAVWGLIAIFIIIALSLILIK